MDTEAIKLQRVIDCMNGFAGARMYTAFGKTFSITQWSAYSLIKRETIASRLRAGWSPERALTEKAVCGNNQFMRY